eukprot:9492091-Prorocentrum_lima.AAC.1
MQHLRQGRLMVVSSLLCAVTDMCAIRPGSPMARQAAAPRSAPLPRGCHHPALPPRSMPAM